MNIIVNLAFSLFEKFPVIKVDIIVQYITQHMHVTTPLLISSELIQW